MKANREHLQMALHDGQDRFVVAYCKNCGDVSAMAVASKQREISWAIKDLNEWEADNRKTAIIFKNDGDIMPKWCDCGKCE